jgi:hypothetical protein
MPALRQLASSGALAKDAVFDWGGGEPTIYPEFDAALTFVTRRGGTTWVHTNGTRLPKPIVDGLSTKRIHILCSVDAGTSATWEQMKKHDLLHVVWRNLDDYVRLGCRVVLKYIVKQDNCDPDELCEFVERSRRTGARELIIDIDYDFPTLSPAVAAGVGTLRRLATARGFYTTFGSTGTNFRPEADAAAQVASLAGGRAAASSEVARWLSDGRAFAARQTRLLLRRLRRR